LTGGENIKKKYKFYLIVMALIGVPIVSVVALLLQVVSAGANIVKWFNFLLIMAAGLVHVIGNLVALIYNFKDESSRFRSGWILIALVPVGNIINNLRAAKVMYTDLK